MRVGNIIKYFREKRGYTQLELAHILGLTKNAISDYENEKYVPSLLVALHMSYIFNVAVEEIFYLVDDSIYETNCD